MSRKILLVDDSRELLDAYVAVLQSSAPHEVRVAHGGRAALEIVRGWRPDIVVTDVLMPDMNGLELISHIGSELPPPLPIVIAWSGFPEFEHEARRRGARVFQPKPVDPDDLVVLIDSLLGERPLPDRLRADAEARRRAASERARAQVSATLARRPYFRQMTQLNARLMSRYFGDADVALLVMDAGQMRVFAASDSRWEVGTRLEGVVGYALDVVESGSTLIMPDLAAVPAAVSRAPVPDAHLLAAVPVRSEGETIGVLALADRRPVAFDVHDLAILEHIGARYADAFSGLETSLLPREPGVLGDESWRYALRAELEHLHAGLTLVVGLGSAPPRNGPTIPLGSPEDLQIVTRTVERLIELLPPRTALGRLAPTTLAAYGLVADAQAGEEAIRSLLATLAAEPRRECAAVLAVRDLRPTDGGTALLEIAHWLLASALARGPGTTMRACLSPENTDHLRAAA
jgi:CheY-like chemotaxis protein